MERKINIGCKTAVAIKEEVMEKLSDSLLNKLKSTSHERLIHDEGTCFIFLDGMSELLSCAVLDELSDYENDVLVVEAYWEKPTIDLGSWKDNPWNVHRIEPEPMLYYHYPYVALS